MRSILFALFFNFVSFFAQAQCTPSGGIPAAPNCSTAVPLTNGANVAAGTTYSDGGASGNTYTGVSVNGGTLVLCGSTTLTNISFNSGVIWVSQGAVVTFNATVAGAALNGSVDAFYNFGTSIFGSAAFPLEVFCNKNGVVYNAAGAFITVHGNVTLNQGNFDNNGTVTADTVAINSLQAPGTACLGPSSTTNITRVLNNDATHPVSVSGAANACIGFNGVYQGAGVLTSSSNLFICVLPGTVDPPTQAQVGAATIINPCSGCDAALPITLVSFTGEQTGDQAELHWETALEQNARCFVIERNTDGRNFIAIDSVAAHNTPSTYTYITRISVDCEFRLKLIDFDGKFAYSPVVRIKAPGTGNYMSLLSSNPVRGEHLQLFISATSKQDGELLILDDMGRVLRKMQVSLVKGSNDLQVDLGGIGPGHYYLEYIGASEKPRILSIIKL